MQTQMHVPPMTRINKIILIITVSFFLLSSVLGSTSSLSLPTILGLSGAGISKGLIFQLITYPFIESNFMGVLFNGLILWFLGGELEKQWGEWFYIKLFLFCVIGTGVLYTAVCFIFLGGTASFVTPLMGLNGFNYALILAYAILYSDRPMVFMFLFPMKAKYFCMLLLAIELYMSVFSAHGVVSLAHIFSMALGFAFLRYMSFVARNGTVSEIRAQRKKEKTKSGFRLIKNEDDVDPPTFH